MTATERRRDPLRAALRRGLGAQSRAEPPRLCSRHDPSQPAAHEVDAKGGAAELVSSRPALRPVLISAVAKPAFAAPSTPCAARPGADVDAEREGHFEPGSE